MRLVSQDKMLDIPYEYVVVGIDQLDPKKIIAYGVNDSNEDFCMPLGSYSSEKKAQKVMSKLHKHYRNNGKNFKFPLDSEVAECLKK